MSLPISRLFSTRDCIPFNRIKRGIVTCTKGILFISKIKSLYEISIMYTVSVYRDMKRDKCNYKFWTGMNIIASRRIRYPRKINEYPSKIIRENLRYN